MWVCVCGWSLQNESWGCLSWPVAARAVSLILAHSTERGCQKQSLPAHCYCFCQDVFLFTLSIQRLQEQWVTYWHTAQTMAAWLKRRLPTTESLSSHCYCYCRFQCCCLCRFWCRCHWHYNSYCYCQKRCISIHCLLIGTLLTLALRICVPWQIFGICVPWQIFSICIPWQILFGTCVPWQISKWDYRNEEQGKEENNTKVFISVYGWPKAQWFCKSSSIQCIVHPIVWIVLDWSETQLRKNDRPISSHRASRQIKQYHDCAEFEFSLYDLSPRLWVVGGCGWVGCQEGGLTLTAGWLVASFVPPSLPHTQLIVSKSQGRF